MRGNWNGSCLASQVHRDDQVRNALLFPFCSGKRPFTLIPCSCINQYSLQDFATSGYTDLHNYTHIELPEDPKNRNNYPKYTFILSSLRPPSPSPTANPAPPKVMLCADNKKDMHTWMAAISQFWQNEEEKLISSQRQNSSPARNPPPQANAANNPNNTSITMDREDSKKGRMPSPPKEKKVEVNGTEGMVNVESVQKKRSNKTGKKIVS